MNPYPQNPSSPVDAGEENLELERALAGQSRWLVWVTEDEPDAKATLQRWAKTHRRDLTLWSLSQDTQAYASFSVALERALTQDIPPSLWVWHDFDPPVSLAARLQRQLRDLAQSQRPLACVFLHYKAPKGPFPPETLVLYRACPPPGVLAAQIASRCLAQDAKPPLPDPLVDKLYEHRHDLARRCVGLERWQMDAALAQAADPKLTDWTQQKQAIERYKAHALHARRLLEPRAAQSCASLGGLAHYKAWLEQRKLAMSPKARALGLQAPRGVLLAGIPGCGKSLAAQVSADVLELSLYRLDLGRMFSGVLGQSEANLRQALRLCERLAPAVIWIDELDKSVSAGDSASDGGTARRSLGTLLSWMQDHRSDVFLVATANEVHGLPPELTRRGRLDEVFFVDLPHPQERAQILALLGCDQWSPDDQAQAKALRQSQDYSGAELKVAVNQARLRALAADREPSWKDLCQALEQTVPLAKARPELIEHMRAWGRSRARPAQAPNAPDASSP